MINYEWTIIIFVTAIVVVDSQARIDLVEYNKHHHDSLHEMLHNKGLGRYCKLQQIQLLLPLWSINPGNYIPKAGIQTNVYAISYFRDSV